MKSIMKIRCIYTYFHQEMENANAAMKMLEESKEQLWKGIRSGLIDWEVIHRGQQKASELIAVTERAKGHLADIKETSKNIVTEEQLRLGR